MLSHTLVAAALEHNSQNFDIVARVGAFCRSNLASHGKGLAGAGTPPYLWTLFDRRFSSHLVTLAIP